MAEYNLGRVAFNDRGSYSNTQTYQKWDFVVTTDSTYLCISELPITGKSILNTTYWRCIADGKPATLAAAAAQVAKENAETAASLANEKAGLANQATIRANTATENANTATTEANTATNKADLAALNANNAADNVKVIPATVRKSYATEALALADKNPLDEELGTPIKVGQLISITNDTTESKNAIYRIASFLEDGTPVLEFQGKLGDMSLYAKKSEVDNITISEDGTVKKDGVRVNPKTTTDRVVDETTAIILSEHLEIYFDKTDNPICENYPFIVDVITTHDVGAMWKLVRVKPTGEVSINKNEAPYFTATSNVYPEKKTGLEILSFMDGDVLLLVNWSLFKIPFWLEHSGYDFKMEGPKNSYFTKIIKSFNEYSVNSVESNLEGFITKKDITFSDGVNGEVEYLMFDPVFLEFKKELYTKGIWSKTVSFTFSDLDIKTKQIKYTLNK